MMMKKPTYRKLVPRVGLEPTQTYVRGILSPLRLPFRHPGTDVLEAAPGFEPGVKVLQTTALPLGYAAVLFSTDWLKSA
jgi:hypothetical protein